MFVSPCLLQTLVIFVEKSNKEKIIFIEIYLIFLATKSFQ